MLDLSRDHLDAHLPCESDEVSHTPPLPQPCAASHLSQSSHLSPPHICTELVMSFDGTMTFNNYMVLPVMG